MFEKYLRRYVGRVPITPARVVAFICGVLFVSSIILYHHMTSDRLVGRYLIYGHPGKLPESGDPQVIRNIELASLKTALTLGYFLNRTVILPAFHCWTCAAKPSSTPSECARLAWKQCELDSVYKWEAFRTQFGNEVQPLHFLSDHALRQRLLENSSPLFVFDSSTTRKRTQNILPSDIKILQVPKNNGDNLPLDTITELLTDTDQYHMLRFHSLYFNIELNSRKLGQVYGKLTQAFEPIPSPASVIL